MSVTIEQLELEVSASSKSASEGLDALSSSLKKLKNALGGGLGLEALDVSKIDSLANSLKKLQSLGNLKISASVATQIRNIGSAVQSLQAIPSDKIDELVSALKPLSSLGKNNLTSYITQLKKLPEVMNTLNSMDIPGLKGKIEQLADAFHPLATEMQNISNGSSALPLSFPRLIQQTDRLSNSNNNAGISYINLWAKARMAYNTLKTGTGIISSLIDQSSKYVEDLNLFTVSLGEYAEQAKEYAQTVGDVMGIDPAEWMRNQGIFDTVLKGFGAVEDRAYTMSRNLTQLGYDISSYFNLSTEDAFQKLQAGIAGELEPLRRLGYDLSVARLQQEAYDLGIKESISSMTQAEKAELRYYAIMTQITAVQGDMARTLEAPANQLRIFQAQLTQCSRALGNIFIPALNAVLPYATAFLQVIRAVADIISKLVGFTLPEIDYSGIKSTADSAGSISGDLADADKQAKKLQRTLMGFDEINRLSEPSSSSSTETGLGSSGLDIELPNYDFLEDATRSKVNEIVEKMKEWLGINKEISSWAEFFDTRLGSILKTVGLIAGGILAWKTINKVAEGVKAISAAFKALLKTKALESFLDEFALIKATGGNTLQAITGGLKNMRNNLTGVQKATITAVAGLLEFTLVKDGVYNLVKGTDDIIGNVAKIGAGAAVAAGAMYVALGPAGLAVAAVVGLAGAITGVIQAQEEMMTAMSNEVFYGGTGTKISDLGNAYTNLMSSITATYQPIIDNQKQIEATGQSIENTSSKIEGILTSLSNVTDAAPEQIEELTKLFGQLNSDSKTIMDEIYSNIFQAISGSFGNALIEAGYDVEEITGMLNEIKGQTDNALSDIFNKQAELDAQYKNGAVSLEEYNREMSALKEQLFGVIGQTNDFAGAYSDLQLQINSGSINWEDADTTAQFFENVKNSTEDAKNAVTDYYNSIQNEIERIMSSTATSDEQKAYLQVVLNNIPEMMATDLNYVHEQLTALYDTVQEDIVSKTQEVKNSAVQAWNEMSPAEQYFSGIYEDQWVYRQVQNYKDNVVTPISEKIQEAYNQLGEGGSQWVTEAMEKITASAFEFRVQFTAGGATFWYKDDMSNAIKQTFSELQEEGKITAGTAGNYIAGGLAEGITSNTPAVSSAAAGMALAGDEALREAAQINSPSKLFGTEGEYMAYGVIGGYENVIPELKNSVTRSINSALELNHAYSYGQEFGSRLGSSIVTAFNNSIKGLRSPEIPAAQVSTSSVKAYAYGGFPDAGSLFIANEAGPEMVGTIGDRTAVANNGQIETALYQAVRKAISDGMSTTTAQGSEQVIRLEVDGDVLAETVVKQNGIRNRRFNGR